MEDLDGAAQVKMPQYQCHKKVYALKIKTVEYVRRVIVPMDPGYGPFQVPEAYLKKHDPKPGGYYVVYDDGYQSYSPAQAFEEGYTLIG